MLMFDRRLLAHFEWALLFLSVIVSVLGLVTVLSATYTEAHPVSSLALRQASWIGLGLLVLLATQTFDYRLLERHAYFLYAAAFLLLLLVPFVGASGGGARRWIPIGPFSVQPSELMKIAVVIAVARFLHVRLDERTLPLRTALIALLLALPPAYLILTQPDLGTALLLSCSILTLLLFAGLGLRWILLAALVAGPLLPLLWGFLKPYQRQRILTFLDPQADPLGAGYHVIQSQIAIGSGQWTGRGFLRGPQNHLNFLPEQHTDFIFSVFAEEWGFVGSLLLLALYALLLVRCMAVSGRAKDGFGMLLAVGLTSMIFWQAAINIGMASGVLPVVGMTLPLFSYGGSSFVVMMLAIGLIMNVGMRRFTF